VERYPAHRAPAPVQPRVRAPDTRIVHGRIAALATTAAVLVVLAAAPAGAAPADAEPTSAGPPTAAQLEVALVAEMNRVRTARDRRPLRTHASLRRPARAQSAYLLGIGDLRHEGRDGSPFWTRIVAAGFPRNRFMGENLAMVSGCARATARRTVAMWMASPGHRANLLNPRFRWVGAGVAIGAGCSSTYLTADYGS
jgi:uncharacterized protein YkwD